MRVVKGLTAEENKIIFIIVDSPPANMRMPEAMAKAKESLFEKVSKTLSNDKLELTEQEWDQLKMCFGDPGWPSMTDRRQAKEILNKKIMKAEYVEDKK
jgi:hypothetical protein